jgi:hypothetical protein
MADWVTLAELRVDVTAPQGSVDDHRLRFCLDAAMACVEAARIDLAADFAAGTVPANVRLGTVRLAARWYRRRAFPEGQVTSELGVVGAIPYTDPDIDRLLGIGRFRRSVIA